MKLNCRFDLFVSFAALMALAAGKPQADLGKLAGKPVRLRFILADADLFSFRFR
jgi:hypothetical protein